MEKQDESALSEQKSLKERMEQLFLGESLSKQKSLKEKMKQLYLEESLKEDLENLIKENERLRNALSETRTKGEWIRMGEAYVCSRCSTTCACTETADKWIWHTDDKFCRGCGANMSCRVTNVN